MRSLISLKTVQDVVSYCNHSYNFNYYALNHTDILSLTEATSWPQNLLINLLGTSRKLKTEIITRSHREFLGGKNIVLVCSLSLSSNVFHTLLHCATNLTFICRRIYDNNKRYDTTIVYFLH